MTGAHAPTGSVAGKLMAATIAVNVGGGGTSGIGSTWLDRNGAPRAALEQRHVRTAQERDQEAPATSPPKWPQ